MAFVTLKVDLTGLLGGLDTNRAAPNPPTEPFIDKAEFVRLQEALAKEYATEYQTISLGHTIPQKVKEGEPPNTSNALVGGDNPTKEFPNDFDAFKRGITGAFETMTQSYVATTVHDRARTVTSRRFPILGDASITIPRYVIDPLSPEDGSSRVASSATAHGIYYTSVPSNNPVELITGVPDDLPKPFVPFMVLTYHVDRRVIDETMMKEFNEWLRRAIGLIVRPFVEMITIHEDEQDKKPVKDFQPHVSGWLLQYFSHTRLYFNSRYPTRMTSLVTCPVYHDNSLCADYIKLSDVMGVDKTLLHAGLSFNRPVNVSI